MTNNKNEDCSIETSEDDAESFTDARATLPLTVRLERAERALHLAGFSLSANDEWLPPPNVPGSNNMGPKTEILTNADLVELTGGLRQGVAQIRWIKQSLGIDAPRKADGHPLLTWRQLGRPDDVPSTRSKINWTKP